MRSNYYQLLAAPAGFWILIWRFQMTVICSCILNAAKAMSLTAGTRLGPYEILAPIGAGGMGEVYRAHDSRLERQVAVKVLHSIRWACQLERSAHCSSSASVINEINH